MKSIIFYIIVLLCNLNAINPKPFEDKRITKAPILKSLVFPGLGELSIGKKNHAKFFGGLEITLWLLVAESMQSKKMSRSNMISYAAIHAGASLIGKEDQFAIDVGNYLSAEEYNNEQQRMRLASRVYSSDGYNWEWDSQENQERYWNYIRKHARANKIGMFAIGGMVVNRIVSIINVSYLNRQNKATPLLKFQPFDINDSIKASKLILFINF
ncbi:MAG: hypothetical protein CMG75_08130 [Candidatus Marinimicrobia bacterium]|nr:hypothetical protein [Candidatus Neomarinimicrobiota bacterium]